MGRLKQSRTHRLRHLGRDQSFRRGLDADLKIPIQKLQEALDAAPNDDPDQANRLENLGLAYKSRWLRTRSKAHLEIAIQLLQEALDISTNDRLGQAIRFHHLGSIYEQQCYSGMPNIDRETALQQSIQQYQKALDLTPKNHPDQTDRLYHLGLMHSYRAFTKRNEVDLDIAIRHLQESVNVMPNNYPNQARLFERLGTAYRQRYQSKHVEADLEIAIRKHQEALNATPKDDPDRANRLSRAGSSYQLRFIDKGSETDLVMTIQHFQEALNLTLKDHPDRASHLEKLGAAYRSRYFRTLAEADLETAIQKLQEALNATPKYHPNWVGRLFHLGLVYRDRYLDKSEEADLQRAVQQLQKAFDMTSKEDWDLANRLHWLGMVYRDRYLREGMDTDLETAIGRLQEAVDIMPNDQYRTDRLHHLGLAYRDRYLRKAAEVDLKTAIQRLQEALDYSISPIFNRLRPSRVLLALYSETENWLLAYQAASTAVSLVPLLISPSLEDSDKQQKLLGAPEAVGLASDAAAIALMAERTPYDAIRLLELGRGVILGSLNETRADVSDLLQQHPHLAEEYIQLRDQLNFPIGHADQLNIPTVAARQISSQRYDAGQRLTRTILAIRNLPEFERFLMAPSEDEFKAAAALGPIVIINVSSYRCDALIIEKDELKSIPLPHLSINGIQTHAAALANPDSVDSQLLEWLWDTIAKPVLDALRLTQVPVGCFPRMWWIPTGLLSKFPIHAAGYHSHSPETVLDRVISSYSSSVSVLVRSRAEQSFQELGRESGKAVLVGMGDTPGLNHLPSVPLEMDQLEYLCSSLKLQVCKPQPYREDVLAALSDCDIFHFAGHGETHQNDPSKSSLVLRDKPLAVADLFKTKVHKRKPFLAYLSACGTGQVKHERLMDETLHLINAFQIAGFRHVIGTLWEVNDKVCVEASTILYQWIQERNMTDDSVSEGLHRASMKLRESWILENTARAANSMTALNDEDIPILTEQASSSKGTVRDLRDAVPCEETPLYWVPYVHFGI